MQINNIQYNSYVNMTCYNQKMRHIRSQFDGLVRQWLDPINYQSHVSHGLGKYKQKERQGNLDHFQL